MTYLEHANITVPDIDSALEFLMDVDPEFTVKKDALAEKGYRWVHIGNDVMYIALQGAHLDHEAQAARTPYRNYGVNHLALVVEDLNAVVERLEHKAYQQSLDVPNETYRRRKYYYDRAGFEWELIEYLSDDPTEKFLYE